MNVHQPVVLVADDESMVRTLVRKLLHGQGFAVLSASDGQEALELSRAHPGPIDLVITDVSMPRLSGIDLCARLNEERPGTPVIVMSGTDVGEIVCEDLDVTFLGKPFSGTALMARVEAVLDASVKSKRQRPAEQGEH